jgi:hypothetical protein
MLRRVTASRYVVPLREGGSLPAVVEEEFIGEGTIGRMGQAEASHWLGAPHSTEIQGSPVHSGVTNDLDATLERLVKMQVRRSATA